jgi:tRNA A-37 threonylcarbamoyl transferase component Bud32
MQKNSIAILAAMGITNAEILLEDGSVLTALEVVRFVPKKRCVCRAISQEKPVYVKLFFGQKAMQYAMRDIRGVEWLQQSRVLTPQLLKHCKLRQLEGYAVIFEEISPVKNAEDIVLHSTETKQLTLAKLLVKTVAEHHDNNLMQTDMYLKNFLVQHQTIYSIDGDGIRQFKLLPKQKALSNLSQLLSKFDVLMLDAHLPLLLNHYAEARGWHGSFNLNEIKLSINIARYKATASYADKKIFRQCTDVDIVKAKSTFSAVKSNYSMHMLSLSNGDIDCYFTSDNIIKNGHTCTVAITLIDSIKVVIKRYNIKSFWHGVSRAWRRTRASVSWANAHRLQLLMLDTAKPIALLEKRKFGLSGKAYFITEYVDAPDIYEFFRLTSDQVLRAQAVKYLVQLFYRLYLLKISHGDMKATNIKVLSNGKSLLIDLDSMQQHRYTFFAKKAHIKDIKRFMRNWKDEPSLYNAFVKVFKVVYADHAPLQAAKILE